ncbi:TPA: hypothetical protein ACH3X2_013734 [Trebouxia sp. C0005]
MQGQDVYADATLHDRLLQSDLPLADEGVAPAHVKLELKALSLLSAPVIVQLTALYAISTVNQYFIGHLGAAPLAAAAIGNTWFNFCWYFLLGVSTGLDTLGSQAHGEGNPNAVISCCVSAITVLSLLCIPVVVALLTADKVAVAIFFQTPESGKLVGVFCKGLLPGLLPLVWSIALLKAMQVQNHVWGPAIMTFATAAANIPINMVLIKYYDFWGAALATSVARILLLLLLCGYTAWLIRFAGSTKPQVSQKTQGQTKSQVTRATVMHAIQRGVNPSVLARFLVLGLPGGVMMAADAASFDVTTVMASVLGESKVDAHALLLTCCVAIYMSFPFGMSTAATIRMGNLVGGNRPAEARLSGYLSVLLGVLFMAAAAIVLFVFRYDIGPLFVDDARVRGEVAGVAPICAAYQIPDGIYGVSSGVLRGLGRQASLMWFNILGFWAVGFTTGYTLTFRFHWGLPGVWWGILSGVMVTALLCGVSMVRVDWEEEAGEAQKHSIARQADRLSQHPSNDGTDVENMLDGIPEQSTSPGVVTPAVEATTGISTAYNPRISIQPFATPGQRCFVGSYGSPSIHDSLSKSWGGRQ